MNCPKCGKQGMVIIPLALVLKAAAGKIKFLSLFLNWAAGAAGNAGIYYHADCGFLAIWDKVGA